MVAIWSGRWTRGGNTKGLPLREASDFLYKNVREGRQPCLITE